MALSPIMLTAWAIGKVPSLHIDGYRETSIDGLDRVTCRTADDVIITIASPTTPEAAKQQDREHAAGRLLSAGVRERLGFDVPHTLAAGLLDKHRMVITQEVLGSPLSAQRDIKPVLPSLARAVANLHSLPTNIVKKNSIPVQTPLDCLRDAAGLIDRAHQTTRVPSALLDRWDAAIEDTELWQFTPTITHGNLELESILVEGTEVVGIVKWAESTVGDPAADIAHVVGLVAPEVASRFVSEYSALRGTTDRRIGHRARFLAELGTASWLLVGVDANDEATVDDAVALLTSLAATVADNPGMALGVGVTKPVNLVVDSARELREDSVFDEDAPTRVAEPLFETAPPPAEEPPPVVTNARVIVDVSESSRTEAGGRPGEVIVDAEVVEIHTTIAETFFPKKPPRFSRDNDEIL